MAKLKDIEGNRLTKLIFGEDGIVYNSNNSTLIDLTYDSCNLMNYEYNSGSCYYVKKNEFKPYKISFNSDTTNNTILTKNGNEEIKLLLSFEYLIDFDSDKMLEKIGATNDNVLDVVNDLDLSVCIEAVDEFGNSEEVFEEDLNHSASAGSGGVILSGDSVSIIKNRLKNYLGVLYNENLLDSDWATKNVVIDDEIIISKLLGKGVRFAIKVKNQSTNFSIIIDNIKFDKLANITFNQKRVIDDVPSFNIERVVDNKKSWVKTNKDRSSDLDYGYFDYKIDDSRELINSKEMDLVASPSKAVKRDVIRLLEGNMGLLNKHDGEPTFKTDLNDMVSLNSGFSSFETKLVDVNSRKIISRYNILEMLYERYLNAPKVGVNSDGYGVSKMISFIELINVFWVDLIEQVVPATTIWNSSNTISNTPFKGNKYKYKPYNLRFCNKDNEDDLVSFDGFIDNENYEFNVTTEMISDNETKKDNCNDVFIKSFSSNCNNVGKVTIINNE